MSDAKQRCKRILALRHNLTHASSIPERVQAHQAIVDMLDDLNLQAKKENVPTSEDSAIDTEMPEKSSHRRSCLKSPAAIFKVQSFPALNVESDLANFELSSTEDGATSTSSRSNNIRRRSHSHSRLNATSLRSPRVISKTTRAPFTNNLLTPDAKQRIFNYEFRGPIPKSHHCQRSLFGKTVDVPDDPVTPKLTPSQQTQRFKSSISVDKRLKPRQMSPALRTALKTSQFGQTLHQTSCDAYRSKPTSVADNTANKLNNYVAQKKLDNWKPRDEPVLPAFNSKVSDSSVSTVLKTPERHQPTRGFDAVMQNFAEVNVFTNLKTPSEDYRTPLAKMANVSSDTSFKSAKEEQTPRRANFRRIERPGQIRECSEKASHEFRDSIDAIRLKREAYISQIDEVVQSLTPLRRSQFSGSSPVLSPSFPQHRVFHNPDSNFVGRAYNGDEKFDIDADVKSERLVSSPRDLKPLEKPVAESTPNKLHITSSPIKPGGVNTSLTPMKLYDDYCLWVRLWFDAKAKLLKAAAKYYESDGYPEKASRYLHEIKRFDKLIEKLKATAKVWCYEFNERNINLVLEKMASIKSDVRESIKKRDQINKRIKESRKSINFSFLGIVNIDTVHIDKVAFIDRHCKTVSRMTTTKPRDHPIPSVPVPDLVRSQENIDSSEASKALLLSLEASAKSKREELRNQGRNSLSADRRAIIEFELETVNSKIATVMSERRSLLSEASVPILSARDLPERLSLVPKLDLSSLNAASPADYEEIVKEPLIIVNDATTKKVPEKENDYETPPPTPVFEKSPPVIDEILTSLTKVESLTMTLEPNKSAASTLVVTIPEKSVEPLAQEAHVDPLSVFSEHRTSRDGTSFGALESLPREAAPPSPEATENDVSTMRDMQEEGTAELQKEETHITASTDHIEAIVPTQPALNIDDNHQSSQEKVASADSHSGFSAFSSLSLARNDASDSLANLPEPVFSLESAKKVLSQVKTADSKKIENLPAIISNPVDAQPILEDIAEQCPVVKKENLSSNSEHVSLPEDSNIYSSEIASFKLLEDALVPSPLEPVIHVDKTIDVADDALKAASVSNEASSSTTIFSVTKSTDKSTTLIGSTVSTSNSLSLAESIKTISDEISFAVESASSISSSSTSSKEPSFAKVLENKKETLEDADTLMTEDADISVAEELAPPPHHDDDISLTTDDFSTSITSEFNRSGRRRLYERVEKGQIIPRLGPVPTYQRTPGIDDDAENLSTSLESIKLHPAPPLSLFASVSPRNSIGKSNIINKSRNSEQRDSLNLSFSSSSEVFDLLNASLTEMSKKFALFDDIFIDQQLNDEDGTKVDVEPLNEVQNNTILSKNVLNMPPSPNTELELSLPIRTDNLLSKSGGFELIKKDHSSVLAIIKEGCQSLWSQLDEVAAGNLNIVDLKLDTQVPPIPEPDHYQAAFKKAILHTVAKTSKSLLIKGVKFENDTNPDILDKRHIWNKLNPLPLKESEALVFESVYKFDSVEVDRIRNFTYNGVIEVLKHNAPEKMNEIH